MIIELDSGKKLELVVDSKSHLKRWQFTSGGELPQELIGLFTQDKYAIEAANRYVDRANSKAKK